MFLHMKTTDDEIEGEESPLDIHVVVNYDNISVSLMIHYHNNNHV